MKKYLSLTLFFMLYLVNNAYSQIMTPDRVIAMISNKFASIDSYYATFVERSGKAIKNGNLVSKSPNLFKLEYSRGTNDQQIYSDGKTLWIIIPQKNVVAEQKLDYGSVGAIYTKEGILNLTSKYNIDFYNERELKPISSFNGLSLNIAGYDSSSYTAGDNRLAYHLLLTPKQSNVSRTGFPNIHLWVGQDGMILRILGISTVNVPVEYLFTSFRYNIKLNDKAFVPNIPEDMQVLKDGLVPKS